MFSGGRANGVRITDRRGRSYDVLAPNIMSSIGLFETVSLLPAHVAENSELSEMSKCVNPGIAILYVVLILNGTREDIGLTSTTHWYFENNDLGEYFKKWFNGELDLSIGKPIPIMSFLSNSAKDPIWSRHPNHLGKSTMHAFVPVNWKWFESLSGKRSEGSEYESVKKQFGVKIVDKLLDLYPKAKEFIEHIEVWTPHKYRIMLGKYKGSVYGLHHDMAKLDDPKLVSRMRPETDIPGLFLTGQDISMGGIPTNIISGIASAGTILGRNTLIDLQTLHMKINKKEDELGSPKIMVQPTKSP